MTASTFTTIRYHQQDRQVTWCGVSVNEGAVFNAFMRDDVASRLHDEAGMAEFEAHLRSLANTGFDRDNLTNILTADIPEARDWAVGEAVAEAYLGREYTITWPWNTERDKRHPKASLPGADLVGFKIDGNDVCLVLGEVKTSTDGRTPPGVMLGRTGMTHQIDNLATDLSLVRQLLYWLFFRCKGTKHEASFNRAMCLFVDSCNTAVAFFGVLIRDTPPNELDLQSRGHALSGVLRPPTTCELIAIYLPCAIADLSSFVTGRRP